LVSCPSDKFQEKLGPFFNYVQPTWGSLFASTPGWTGILLILIMSFSFTLATHSFRRSVVKLPSPLHHLAGFNAFWYAHHLLVFAYILLVMHSYFIFLTKEWYKRTVFFLHLFGKSSFFLNLIFMHKNSNCNFGCVYTGMDVLGSSCSLLCLRESYQKNSRKELWSECHQGKL
jgi:hypothetical protein